ncbi:MAG: type IX secretion system membrane protein PorP/SprF [Bacteroidales bacterium]
MKKYSIAIFFVLFLVFCDDVQAQQEPQFSHNMFNNMGINPGFAGMRSAICATALARQQWVGFKDEEGTRLNPETYSFTVDAPISFLRGGLGIGFLQDQLAFEKALGIKVAYAYHLDLDVGRLGLGAQVGFLDKRFDFSGFNPLVPNDPALTGSGEQSRMLIDMALGAFYQLDDKAWAGLSVSQLTQTRRDIGDGTAEYGLKRHFYLAGGYNYSLNPSYVFSPSVLIKSDLGSVQADFNGLITYNKRFWGGVSYRLQDAAVVFLGLTFEQISIGYSYDITLSPLGRSGRSFGSHEIMLQYCFDLDLEKVRQTHRNVRFL